MKTLAFRTRVVILLQLVLCGFHSSWMKVPFKTFLLGAHGFLVESVISSPWWYLSSRSSSCRDSADWKEQKESHEYSGFSPVLAASQLCRGHRGASRCLVWLQGAVAPEPRAQSPTGFHSSREPQSVFSDFRG